MVQAHFDDRVVVEMSEAERVDRVIRILQILETDDAPRFNFYEHEYLEGSSNSR
jgi:hypothetical protein